MDTMNIEQPEITVVMPALNEEKNVSSALCDTLKAFTACGLKGEIVFIDDGSGDATGRIARSLADQDARVRIFRHERPQGLGVCFKEGVGHARAPAVVFLPGDNENFPREIFRYYRLLDDVDMVVPFVFNKEVRPASRNRASWLYRCIVNAAFAINLNYTNGTVLFRTCVVQDVDFRTTGFFYQADLLIRLLKRGYLFAEVPYRLRKRMQGDSKAVSWKSLRTVITGFLLLFVDIYFRRTEQGRRLHPDSQTALRRASE